MKEISGLPRVRGSFSVEAAWVISLLILVLGLILQITLFLTDAARMQALMREKTQISTMERPAAKENKTSGFFLLNPSRLVIQRDGKEVSVSYPEEKITLGFGLTERFSAEAVYRPSFPVPYLRRVRNLLALLSIEE